MESDITYKIPSDLYLFDDDQKFSVSIKANLSLEEMLKVTASIPERTCHTIIPLEERYFPESLKVIMKDSLDGSFHWYKDHDSDGFLDKHGTHISLYVAAYLLQKYDFEMEQKTGEFGFPKQNDTEYIFECITSNNSYPICVS